MLEQIAVRRLGPQAGDGENVETFLRQQTRWEAKLPVAAGADPAAFNPGSENLDVAGMMRIPVKDGRWCLVGPQAVSTCFPHVPAVAFGL